MLGIVIAQKSLFGTTSHHRQPEEEREGGEREREREREREGGEREGGERKNREIDREGEDFQHVVEDRERLL